MSPNLPQASIDAVNNKLVTVTLFEALPKEKTAVLASCETSLSHFLQYPSVEGGPGGAGRVVAPDTRVSKHLPLAYVSPKLLQSGPPGGQEDVPELEIDLEISALLVAPEAIEEGNFITLKLDDVFPLPEEWSLREGTEKDLNSSMRVSKPPIPNTQQRSLPLIRHLFIYTQFCRARL